MPRTFCSLVAALSGLALVAVFVVVAYRLPGAVAVLALARHGYSTSRLALIPVTLTLPGIADSYFRSAWRWTPTC